MSKFFCDSNCELWFDKIDALNIEVIRMPYIINNEQFEYDMGRETDNRLFFDKMRKGASPKTAALNQTNYIDYFEPVLASGEDIIYVSFTHQMSATFASMDLAIAELKLKYPSRTITTCDSGHISMGAGLVVYYAALKHNDGATDAEVSEFVSKFRKRVNCHIIVDDLVYLKRGGRLSSFKTMMGTILNMKPIIVMSEEGKLENIGTVKGRKKAISTLVDVLEEKNFDSNFPIVLMDGDTTADVEFTANEIREKYGADIEIWSQLVGPVVGSHCGPGTIGLLFVSKE